MTSRPHSCAVRTTPKNVAQRLPPSVLPTNRLDWCKLKTSKAPSRTTLEHLEVTPLSAAYRVHITAGTSWKPPAGVALFVMAGRPRHQGETVYPGDEIARMAGTIENRQKQPVTLLAVGSPIV